MHSGAGDRALRQILEDALCISDRCVNPDDRDSITKTVSNVESMLDALCELRQQGKVIAHMLLSLLDALMQSCKLELLCIYYIYLCCCFIFHTFFHSLEDERYTTERPNDTTLHLNCAEQHCF